MYRLCYSRNHWGRTCTSWNYWSFRLQWFWVYEDGDNGFISVNVTGGTEVYTYSWTADNGFTSSEEDISNLSAGIYTLVVTTKITV